MIPLVTIIMTSVGIVDYGVSNIRSVQQALAAAAPRGMRLEMVTDATGISRADRLVFPGQGAAHDCMRALSQCRITNALRTAMREKPFLGICMGLQMLLERSCENDGTICLGIFAGTVHHLAEHGPATAHHKIPHMGWNQVTQVKTHPLWQGIDDNAYFYFVHSYYGRPDSTDIIAATTEYGKPFACALADQYIFAAQFHPEKSAANGMQLLKNFLCWNGET